MRWFRKSKKRRIIEAQAEMFKMLRLLAMQHAQIEVALNDVIDALNRFGAVVGLEWNRNDRKWQRLQ